MPLSPSKIRSRMDRLGVTAAELSRRVGMRPPHVSRILTAAKGEAAYLNVKLDRAEDIADALDCTVDDLLA